VLRGKSKGIRAYTPIKEKIVHDTRELIYEHAYVMLTDDDPDSQVIFSQLASLYPEDPLIALHLERIKEGEFSTTIIVQST